MVHQSMTARARLLCVPVVRRTMVRVLLTREHLVPIDDPAQVGAQWRAQSSAHRFLHEGADPCLFGGSQLLQREGDRPNGAFVEVRLVAEAERRIPRLELLFAL